MLGLVSRMFRATAFEEKLTIPRSITCKLNNSRSDVSVFYIFGPDNKRVVYPVNQNVRICLDKGFVRFIAYSPTARADCGSYARIIRNIFQGLEKPFSVYLELRGLGYRMKITESGAIEFFLGYSHAITFYLPHGVSAAVVGSKNRVLELTAMSWGVLKQCAAKICSLKRRNPYKEKGVFFKFERVTLRGGKKKKFS